MKKVGAIQCLHQTNMGVSHTYSSLCRDDLNNIDFINYIPSSEGHVRKNNFVETIPRNARWLVYKLKLDKWITEKALLNDLHKLDIVYAWPEVSMRTVDRIKGKVPIVIERINCFTGKSKFILDEEYRRLGLKVNHNICDELVRYEIELINKVDYVFCPSEEVRKSFLEIGVQDSKLLSSSYGWCDKRFNINNLYSDEKEIKYDFLFVGRISVRKGAHLLIEYFIESGVDGKLLLCGNMDKDVVDICGKYLSSEKIQHVSYTKNVTELFKSSRFFVFPSLEEGDPLVTYEAMLHGLPVLTTPMGAGSGLRDQIDGWIIDPYCKEQWISKFRELNDEAEKKGNVAHAFNERLDYFEFKNVAKRRAEIFKELG